MGKVKLKTSIVLAMAEVLEDYAWIVRGRQPCEACGDNLDMDDNYCRGCGTCAFMSLDPLDEEIVYVIWSAFKAGLSEWKKK